MTGTRTCFVIMPFAGTASCSEDEWTEIFSTVIKPAVEGAGLGYDCRRSRATRGNLVREILEDLQGAYVVVADLTDRNANVFYELGVRHTLTNRTILLAQRRDDIPFDLVNYANHVYDWRTPAGRAEMADRMRVLLEEVDSAPDRPDNPISDFLGVAPPLTRALPERLLSLEARLSVVEQVVASAPPSRPGSVPIPTSLKDLSPDEARAAVSAVSEARSGALRLLLMNTRREIDEAVRAAVQEADATSKSGRVAEKDIPTVAAPYVDAVLRITPGVEAFALAACESRWTEGIRAAISLAAGLIELGEATRGRLRFTTGMPAFAGWRLLILMGAKLYADGYLRDLRLLVTEPLEVQLATGAVSHQRLAERPDLFHPDVFLGYANYAVLSVANTWTASPHLASFFASEAEFQQALAGFLVVVALTDEAPGHPLYPGYRLIPGAQREIQRLHARASANPAVLSELADAMGMDEQQLRAEWQARADRANAAELGGLFFTEARIPRALGPVGTR